MSTQPDPLHADFAWLASTGPVMSSAYWAAHGVQAASWRPAVPEVSGGADTEEIRQVGRRFEAVHRQAMQASSEVEVLACNHQIRSDKRTLGELDMLYRHNGAVVHREVAVKFYLAVGQGRDPSAWIGSSRKDRLSLKLGRLRTQQIELPRIAQAADAWPQELPFPDRSEVLLLGALFAPEGDARLPEGADPSVERGCWWFASDFAARYGGSGWCVLPRPRWLSPAHAHSLPAEDAAAIAARVQEDARPRFVAAIAGDAVRRGFVVPDGWWDDLSAVP